MSRSPKKRETLVSRSQLNSSKSAAAAGVFALAVGLGIATGYEGPRVAVARSSFVQTEFHQSNFSSVEDGTWIVSGEPGSNSPPIGRSLFDFLTMVDVGNGTKKQVIPFPFQKLVAAIQAKVKTESSTPGLGLKSVLIPLGRSLQRSASAPDFFRFPRVVVGVDGFPTQGEENGTGMLLRDRLFVGYNEKASVLEIVSYNEAAGRYEFQVARDYRAGGTSRAVYANRSVCLSCHQNASPIFSDRPWQETNANNEITEHLKAAMSSAPLNGSHSSVQNAFDGRSYMGVPLAVSEAQPQGLDNAKFRSNLIPATHFLWQRLCETTDGSANAAARCRGQALSIALRMGLTNQLEESSPLFAMREVRSFLENLATTWKKRWPTGLLISNPRIPNRNPFEKPKNSGLFDAASLRPEIVGAIGGLIRDSHIPAEFEPLNRRPALDKWTVLAAAAENTPDLSGLANWFRQLSAFFTPDDLESLDRWASARAREPESRKQVTGLCELISYSELPVTSPPPRAAVSAGKVSFQCDGETSALRLAGFLSWDVTGNATGALDTLALRTDPDCELVQRAGADSCPEAIGMVLRGKVMLTRDGGFEAKLTAVNRINSQRTRFSDGNRLESLEFQFRQGAPVSVHATVLLDFPFIEHAIARAVQDTAAGRSSILAQRPFRRTAVLTHLRSALGGPATAPKDCCEADNGMPLPIVDESAVDNEQLFAQIVGPSAPFLKECAICHRNNNGFPPNYLTGSVADVEKQLSQCAERLWFRLNMYDVAKADRGQSPMPPAARLEAQGMTEEQWRKSDSLKNLRAAALDLLKRKGLDSPDVKGMTYQSLPTCFGNSFSVSKEQ